MAKDFSFPFYVNNWIGGTMYLTHEQKGAYLDLLLMQFNLGKFTMAQAKQVLNTCYQNAWPAIADKFETDGTFFWNAAMQNVKKEREAFVESRRNNRLGKTKEITSVNQVSNISLTSVKRMEDEDESEVIIKSKNFKQPALPEIFAYFAERNFEGVTQEEGQKFFNYYESNGWRVGKNKMKDWRAAIRNWISNYKQYNTTNNGKPTTNHRTKQSDTLFELAQRANAAQTAIAGGQQQDVEPGV